MKMKAMNREIDSLPVGHRRKVKSLIEEGDGANKLISYMPVMQLNPLWSEFDDETCSRIISLCTGKKPIRRTCDKSTAVRTNKPTPISDESA